MRQVATSSNLQIVEPAEADSSGVTLSPDGNYVYYTTGSVNSPIRETLTLLAPCVGTSTSTNTRPFARLDLSAGVRRLGAVAHQRALRADAGRRQREQVVDALEQVGLALTVRTDRHDQPVGHGFEPRQRVVPEVAQFDPGKAHTQPGSPAPTQLA